MKTIKNEYKSCTEYKIIFGVDLFIATQSKEYPNVGKWDLSRRTNQEKFFDVFFPCGGKRKFKNLKEIKKFIRNREYM